MAKREADSLSVDKFNIAQMFNNSKGKTSGMLFISIMACFSAVMCFVIVGSILVVAGIYGMVHKIAFSDILTPDITSLFKDLISQALILFFGGASGLGIRRFTPDKLMGDTSTIETTKTQTDTTSITNGQ